MVFQLLMDWMFSENKTTDTPDDWLTCIQNHLLKECPEIGFREYTEAHELFEDLRESGYGGQEGQIRFYFENSQYLAEDYGVDAVSVLKEYLYGVRLIEHSPSTTVYQGKRFFTDSFLLLDILVRREKYQDHLQKLNSKC